MKATQVIISDSDARYFRVEEGVYRYGVFLERDKPGADSTRANLCVYRVPTGTRAPYGRIPDEVLLLMADAALKEVQPEVIGRFPYFSAWYPLNDVPADTVFEETVVLPSPIVDRFGNYVQPVNAFTPVATAADAASAEGAPVKAGKGQ